MKLIEWIELEQSKVYKQDKKVVVGVKCFKCGERTEILKMGVGFVCYECKPEGEE